MCERLVDLCHRVGHLFGGLGNLGLAVVVGLAQHVGASRAFEQTHRSAEGGELVEPRHVDAVVVGVAHLGRRRHHDDAHRVQAVEDAEDALLQRGAAHYAVVDHHKGVAVGHDAAVGHVVDVRRKVVARAALGNEGAQLDVLDGYLLHAHLAPQYVGQGLVAELAGSRKLAYAHAAHVVEVLVEGLYHAYERHLGRVGDEGEHRAVEVRPYHFGKLRHNVGAQGLALEVDAGVAAAREVHALERAPCVRRLGQYALYRGRAFAVDYHGAAGLELLDVGNVDVEHRLYHRALRRHHNHFVVDVVERRTYARRVAQGEGSARTRCAAYGVAAVP